jgi:hypothetical protein
VPFDRIAPPATAPLLHLPEDHEDNDFFLQRRVGESLADAIGALQVFIAAIS